MHTSLRAFGRHTLLLKHQMPSAVASGLRDVGPWLPGAAWLEQRVCPEGMGGAEPPLSRGHNFLPLPMPRLGWRTTYLEEF